MGERADAHVARFNAAVTSGDWAPFLASFDPGARADFIGVRAGPYIGQDAIAAGYRENPPDDTIVPRTVRSTEGVDEIQFDWTRGGSGVLRLHWTPDERIAAMMIEFR